MLRAVFASSTSSDDPTLNSEPAGNDAFSTVVVVWVEIFLTNVLVSIVRHVPSSPSFLLVPSHVH